LEKEFCTENNKGNVKKHPNRQRGKTLKLDNFMRKNLKQLYEECRFCENLRLDENNAWCTAGIVELDRWRKEKCSKFVRLEMLRKYYLCPVCLRNGIKEKLDEYHTSFTHRFPPLFDEELKKEWLWFDGEHEHGLMVEILSIRGYNQKYKEYFCKECNRIIPELGMGWDGIIRHMAIHHPEHPILKKFKKLLFKCEEKRHRELLAETEKYVTNEILEHTSKHGIDEKAKLLIFKHAYKLVKKYKDGKKTKDTWLTSKIRSILYALELRTGKLNITAEEIYKWALEKNLIKIVKSISYSIPYAYKKHRHYRGIKATPSWDVIAPNFSLDKENS